MKRNDVRRIGCLVPWMMMALAVLAVGQACFGQAPADAQQADQEIGVPSVVGGYVDAVWTAAAASLVLAGVGQLRKIPWVDQHAGLLPYLSPVVGIVLAFASFAAAAGGLPVAPSVPPGAGWWLVALVNGVAAGLAASWGYSAGGKVLFPSPQP